MNVLICSQHGEFQVEEVCNYLKKLGKNPVIFERYRKDHFISYFFQKGEAQGVLNIQGKKYPLSEEVFPAVWYRPKPILLAEIPGENASIEGKFCMHEWKSILQAFDLFLRKSKWINPLRGNPQAANKAYQLQLASQMGLKVPDTIITNDADDILPLFLEGQVIYKTLSSFYTSKKTIYTNEVDRNQILQNKEGISMAPGIFQQLCKKSYELRVTLVGEEIFTVKINSQRLPSAALDWRRSPDSKLYEVSCLSKNTSEKLLSFHKELKLIYAAYDFIVDNDGNEIFLECNPSGQWLWLEQALSLNISSALAKELITIH